MSDDTGKVDEILDELDLDEATAETSTDPVKDGNRSSKEQQESIDRLGRLHEAGAITDAEYEILQEHFNSENDQDHEGSSAEETTKFGTVPVQETIDAFEISILGVFPGVDISTFVYDHQLDGENPERTVVLWDVFNKSGQRAKWGNRGVEYVLDDRLQVSPDTEYLPDLDKLNGPWDYGPQSGTIPEIGANTRGRWVSLVNHSDSQRVVEAVLKGREHREVTLELPESVFGNPNDPPLDG